ncbi:jg3339 [Pararge aegeria aegeria]|uniref:Jg3339 protein n=1 Tax=Pararge aegeria aegeria TaxID=348720 RepID=A0A8S4RUJ7_9NEOP|nr:jg3339 [Pararge aegeria aegeria]
MEGPRSPQSIQPLGAVGSDPAFCVQGRGFDSHNWRACKETEETPIHVMLQCNGVAEQRAAHLGSSATLHEALGDLGGLLSFWSELGWLE